MPPRPPLFEFDGDTIYRSSRGVVGRVLYGIRRLLRPVLKLFFNPTPIVHALHTQQQINAQIDWMMERSEQIAAKLKARAELDALTYELLNNLVVEMTRLSIDVKNHKMRVESIAAAGWTSTSGAPGPSRAWSSTERRSCRRGTATVKARVDDAAGPEKRKRRRRRGRRRSGARAADAPQSEVGGADEVVATDAERPADGPSGPEPVGAEVSAPEPAAGPVTRDGGAEVTAETQSEASGARNGAPDPDEPTVR